MLTAYDYTMAKRCRYCWNRCYTVEIQLDVMAGHENTPITLDKWSTMLHRLLGDERALIVVTYLWKLQILIQALRALLLRLMKKVVAMHGRLEMKK
jgi:hypothetical protein